MKEKKYTVVLLCPEKVCEEYDYGQEIYVATVVAASIKDAIVISQKEAAAGYRRGTVTPEQFKLCISFEGHPPVALFGWQYMQWEVK